MIDPNVAVGVAEERDRLLRENEELRRACRDALPWLCRLGDFIGNGEKDKPMGRCDAILAIRDALRE